MIKKIFNKTLTIIRSQPLVLTLVLYFISLLLVKPWGEYAINDDFYYLTQIKAFTLGLYKKSALVTPNFILQGLMGLSWTSIFGLSYLSLRILTILISIFCLIVIDRILKIFKVGNELRCVGLILITFNPIFYTSSLSFMTENYFLLFTLLSFYYYLQYLKGGNSKSLLLASVMGGLSIMVRQYGFVLVPIYLILFLSKGKNKKITDVLYLFPTVILGMIGTIYPKYINPNFPKSNNFTLFFTSLNTFLTRLTDTSYLAYTGYVLIPFTIIYFLKCKTKFKILIIPPAMSLALNIFKGNVFKVGNVFYLEGLYAKNFINIRMSLLNNSIFKLILSFLISLSLCTVFILIIQATYKIIKKEQDYKTIFNNTNFLVIPFVIAFYFIALFTDRVFDRYFLNYFVFITLYALLKYSVVNHKNICTTFFLAFMMSSITLFISTDYYRQMNVKWKMANDLYNFNYADRSRILIDTVYLKTSLTEEWKNYRGYKSMSSQGFDPVCFVQDYSVGDGNIFCSLLDRVQRQEIFNKYLPNPKIKDISILKNEKNHFDSADDLIFDQEYLTPMYNLLGKRMFVRAFCLRDPR